jgi:hypothetical protein
MSEKRVKAKVLHILLTPTKAISIPDFVEVNWMNIPTHPAITMRTTIEILRYILSQNRFATMQVISYNPPIISMLI